MEPKAPPPVATDAELDEALARAIRQLIAEAIDADTQELADDVDSATPEPGVAAAGRASRTQRAAARIIASGPPRVSATR